jgi:hypothetical protein
MIVMSTLHKPAEERIFKSGKVIQIHAAPMGPFIVHRGQPVIFNFNGEPCTMGIKALCDASGRDLEALNRLYATDCEDHNHDNASPSPEELNTDDEHHFARLAQSRVARGETAIQAYIAAHPDLEPDKRQSALKDLLTGLHHWADHEGLDFEWVARNADRGYEDQVREYSEYSE